MAALWNRAGHYILTCGFFLFFLLFSAPNLSGWRLDVYRTCTRGVALVMAALCNRGPLYFCPVISIFPRLISAATDWISTILLHMAWP